jgi:hypothetical protein
MMLVPDAVQRASGAPQIRDRYDDGKVWRSRVSSAPFASLVLRSARDTRLTP